MIMPQGMLTSEFYTNILLFDLHNGNISIDLLRATTKLLYPLMQCKVLQFDISMQPISILEITLRWVQKLGSDTSLYFLLPCQTCW